MIIGIDLDNTIVRYDGLFKRVAYSKKLISKDFIEDKNSIRNFLLSKKNGKNIWKKLQGLVYGKYMKNAELMPNVFNFLCLCKFRKHTIYIVSHKTEFGHFDKEKISLRNEAIKWMNNKGFFKKNYFNLKKQNIFFANTRSEKVKIISELKCNWFIDDLPEVFSEKNFPNKTKKILFGKNNRKFSTEIINLNSWDNISKKIIGNVKKNDVINWIKIFQKKQIINLKQIKGHGNSRLYKMKLSNKKINAIKYYPDKILDNRPRLEIEYETLKFLRNNNINNVPKVVTKIENLNIGIYEWIDGKKLKNPKMKDIDQAIVFIKKLKKLSNNVKAKKIQLATESCLSAGVLINQIENKLNKLIKIKSKYKKLANFLDDTFIPLWLKVKVIGLKKWPISSRNKLLNKSKQILSPSDFGFHNSLKKNGRITFIDFEYFGWDDPVKLTADFLWHPSMSLKKIHMNKWKKAMKKIFINDNDFYNRLNASMPLFGLRWVMIILNEFLPEKIKVRRDAIKSNSFKNNTILNLQLNKAIKYCKKVEFQINQI